MFERVFAKQLTRLHSAPSKTHHVCTWCAIVKSVRFCVFLSAVGRPEWKQKRINCELRIPSICQYIGGIECNELISLDFFCALPPMICCIHFITLSSLLYLTCVCVSALFTVIIQIRRDCRRSGSQPDHFFPLSALPISELPVENVHATNAGRIENKRKTRKKRNCFPLCSHNVCAYALYKIQNCCYSQL